ncbi:hypothetical protein [Pseudomonas sp. HY7a-MNA-CIBAN-0227]|uniref:hypothetical protein n=1 Tax=Pseudomonas sp. HY7a-MNA-CIBAN-0227 TaxID=3140474 RepID=UPI003333A335
MQNTDQGLYEHEVIDMIAQDISQSKYSQAARKILERVNSGFYNKDELATGEAFYTEFKNFSANDLNKSLQDSEIIAKDGNFITREGLKIGYEAALNRVIEPGNIELYVEQFLSSHYGEEAANKYASNLQAQKDFAIDIYTSYFDKYDLEVSHKAISSTSIYALYDEVKHSMPEHTSFKTDYVADRKFGVPSFELSRGGATAEFSTGVEVRHMLTDKAFVDQIKYSIANPKIMEDLQEDVWLRHPQNEKPNLIKNKPKNRMA